MGKKRKKGVQDIAKFSFRATFKPKPMLGKKERNRRVSSERIEKESKRESKGVFNYKKRFRDWRL